MGKMFTLFSSYLNFYHLLTVNIKCNKGVQHTVPVGGTGRRHPGLRGRLNQGAQAHPLHLLRLLPGNIYIYIFK